MKSFVQTIRLSEPIKPADKTKPVDSSKQTNKQNNESAEQRNSFQAMLNRQVQDKQLENQRIQLKQTQAKSASNVDDSDVQNQLSEISTSIVNVEVEKQLTGKDQLEVGQGQALSNSNSLKSSALRTREFNIDHQSDDVSELPIEIDKHATIVDAESTSLNDKKSDSQILTHQLDDVSNINAQAQATVVNQLVNSTPKVTTDSVTEENSKATIDEMVDQKLASDLRQKSMNKTELNEKQLEKTDDETRLLSENEEEMNEAFQDKLNQMHTKNDKGVPIGQTLNQTVNNLHSKERVGHYEAIKSMLPNEASIRNDFSTNTQGIMNAQANMQQNLVQSNPNVMANQVGSTQFIPQAFGKTGWSEAINQRVMYMVNANEQTATLTLNPPDLGPLQVVISVNNDKADTTFISDNADVRQALQDGMDNLREKMNEAGISLGQSNVNSGAQQQASQTNIEKLRIRNSDNLSNTLIEPVGNAITKVSVNNGLVDLFA